jgi:hypothetical protein
MADRKEDARLGLICQAAYFARGAVDVGTPPPAIPLPPGMVVRGYLSAQDAIFRGENSGQRVYYGVLAESTIQPGNFVAAIRGTVDMIEWGENGEFALITRGGGKVEVGFYSIYETLWLDDVPADAGIFAKVGTAGTLTIVGHSLGGAIATYLTKDVAGIPGMRVRGRYFASPHPGDAAYAAEFDSQVADYVSYAYELDVVPRVPFGFGYSHLAKMAWLSPKDTEAKIRFDVGCHHYLSSYISMLDYALFPAAAALDKGCGNCVKSSMAVAMAPKIPTAAA